MVWSTILKFADKIAARPCWLERDGKQLISVRGYSLVDSAAALFAGVVVLAACVGVLAVMP